MRLTLVRHGQTQANLAGVLQGQKDGVLTQLGAQQARMIGEFLKDRHFDIIYISDLKRTKDTAAQIIKHHPKADVIYDQRIREVNVGNLEGKPWGSLGDAALQAKVDKMDFKPEGGESTNEFQSRIERFLEDITEKHVGKSVLLITHGGVILASLLALTDEVNEHNKHDYLSNNTGVTIIENNKIITYNELPDDIQRT